MGLSDTDANNYDTILRYKSGLLSQNVSIKPESDITRLREDCNTDDKIVSQLHQKQKRLNDDEVKQIIAGYKSGLSMEELAKQFECHRTTISQKLKIAGIKLHGIPASKNQIDEMTRLYKSGLSLVDVGKQVGAAANTVLRYLRQQGIEIRSQGQ